MTTHVCKIDRGPMMSFGIVWTKLKCVLELCFRAQEVPVINELEKTKRAMGLSQTVVKLQSFTHRLLRFDRFREVIVAISQTCVSQRVVRIFTVGLLVVFDSFLHSVDRELVEVVSALLIVVIILSIFFFASAESSLLFTAQLH